MKSLSDMHVGRPILFYEEESSSPSVQQQGTVFAVCLSGGDLVFWIEKQDGRLVSIHWNGVQFPVEEGGAK